MIEPDFDSQICAEIQELNKRMVDANLTNLTQMLEWAEVKDQAGLCALITQNTAALMAAISIAIGCGDSIIPIIQAACGQLLLSGAHLQRRGLL